MHLIHPPFLFLLFNVRSCFLRVAKGNISSWKEKAKQFHLNISLSLSFRLVGLCEPPTNTSLSGALTREQTMAGCDWRKEKSGEERRLQLRRFQLPPLQLAGVWGCEGAGRRARPCKCWATVRPSSRCSRRWPLLRDYGLGSWAVPANVENHTKMPLTLQIQKRTLQSFSLPIQRSYWIGFNDVPETMENYMKARHYSGRIAQKGKSSPVSKSWELFKIKKETSPNLSSFPLLKDFLLGIWKVSANI